MKKLLDHNTVKDSWEVNSDIRLGVKKSYARIGKRISNL